ncbi:DUF2935 domain-containing protein [Paenibacillus tyrfis]|uniref:DUF2935 domain-containing protein n=1 Tax=Paenibacillus tyrfis TaxID=1501230 RepID=UPI0015C5B656|nr:DUF2935 domain-containing protein [Paenibacillus tyrfis]
MRYSQMTAWDEHRFWIEILEDHAYFMRDYLSPAEEKWVDTAQEYIEAFRGLRERLYAVDRDLPYESPEMAEFAKAGYSTAVGYFQFEGNMQHLQVQNRVNLNLTPTFLNGTLNENQEYLRLLLYAMRAERPPELPLVDLIDLWLEDQLGHAVLARNALDPVEIPLSLKVHQVEQEFQAHIVKNKAIRGYLRFTPPLFPVQRSFAKEVSESVVVFYHLIEHILDLYRDSPLLNRATLRFLEHHLPETRYFLRKLANFNIAVFEIPDCPLTQPTLS